MTRLVVELAPSLVERLAEGRRKEVPRPANLFEVARELQQKKLAALLERFGNPPSSPLIRDESFHSGVEGSSVLSSRASKAAAALLSTFLIDVNGLAPRAQEKLLEGLQSLDGIIDTAEFELTSEEAGISLQDGPVSYVHEQEYLAALGVNDVVRGNGEWYEVGFAALEFGWNLDHEALSRTVAAPPALLPAPTDPKYMHDWSAAHGTSVLGICVGGGKMQGIAAGARVKALLRAGRGVDFANTIYELLDNSRPSSLRFGDILLVELQQSGDDHMTAGLPLEVHPAVFRAIQLAVSLGIVVIEVAGNGRVVGTTRRGWDLDNIARDRRRAPAWAPRRPNVWKLPVQLLINAPRFVRHPVEAWTQRQRSPDSGAILVSGCLPPDSNKPPKSYTADARYNSGERVDCYGWGSGVFTCGEDNPPTIPKPHPNRSYDRNFKGTSAAAAMITGVALAIQRMANEVLGYPLSPFQLRAVLRDPRGGVPVSVPGKPQRIVPHLPSIHALLEELPRLFIKSFDDDDGTGRLVQAVDAQSPDIFLSAKRSRNPRARRDRITPGQKAYVYVGVRNLGDAPATAVRATAHWSIHNEDPNAKAVWYELEESQPRAVPPHPETTLLGPIEFRVVFSEPKKIDIMAAAGARLDPRPLIPPARTTNGGLSRAELLEFLQANASVAVRTFELG